MVALINMMCILCFDETKRKDRTMSDGLVLCAEMTLRTQVVIRIGDKLVFDPGTGPLGGESKTFFLRYRGMSATVRGFDKSKRPPLLRTFAVGEGADTSINYDRVFVDFSNGESPTFSVSIEHFRLPTDAEKAK